MTRMLRPLSSSCWTAQSTPATTEDSVVTPSASATLTLTRLASGAMPTYWDGSLYGRAASSVRPAMMLAIIVPWP